MSDTGFDALRGALVEGAEAHRRRRRHRDRLTAALGAVVLLLGLAVWLDDGADEVGVATDGDVPAPSTTVTTTTSSTTPEPGSPPLAQDQAREARELVEDFVEALRAGDVEGVMAHWSGYPYFGPGRDTERAMAVESLARSEIATAFQGPVTYLVNPSWGWTAADAVVTVLSPEGADGRPVAMALLVGVGAEFGGDIPMIQRIQGADGYESPVRPSPGSEVRPGDRIVIDGVPTEGGARAFVGTTELSVEVDHRDLTMSVVIPDDVAGPVALTVSASTPELPGAVAYAYVVVD